MANVEKIPLRQNFDPKSSRYIFDIYNTMRFQPKGSLNERETVLPTEAQDSWMTIRPKGEEEFRPIHALHKLFVDELKDKGYLTCTLHEKAIFVKFSSPEDVQKNVGMVEIQAKTWYLEFINHYNKIFVCLDIRGASINRLIHGIDTLPIATTASIGILRQKNCGPLAVLEVFEALNNCASITVHLSSTHKLEFVRAGAVCELCGSENHSIGRTCMELDCIKDIAPPSGFYSVNRSRFSELHQKIEAKKGKEKENLHRDLEQLYDEYVEMREQGVLMCMGTAACCCGVKGEN
jgi:hypothetical protein